MKLSLENIQKKQRVKNLWKVDYPPQDPEQRWAWIYEVEDHLFGTREMQNELVKAWGFSYTRKDRRKKPLRDKMGLISLRARDRELKILQLRSMNLSFRQIGAQLGISHVACMETALVGDGRKPLRRTASRGCLISIRDLLERWIRYYEKLDSTASEKVCPAPHHNG